MPLLFASTGWVSIRHAWLRLPAEHQTSGSGLLRYLLLRGCGSAPSDPRLTYNIGNRGRGKSEKIRKIGKACSTLLSRIIPAYQEGLSWECQAGGCVERRIHHAGGPGGRSGNISSTIPPAACFQSLVCLRCVQRNQTKQALPSVNFERTRGATLETFSCRSELTGRTTNAKHAQAGLSAIWGSDGGLFQIGSDPGRLPKNRRLPCA
jgi:hypothetical protein